MALNASLNKFKMELSESAARNAQYSRPSSTAPARTSTPKPGGADNNKRTHDTAFSSTIPAATTAPAVGHAGREMLTQVLTAVKYLKEKDMRPVTFENLIGYLSLPIDAEKTIPHIKTALMGNAHVTYLSKDDSGNGKESFKYRPTVPVTNAEELKDFLATQQTAQGVTIKDLKDGWPDCGPALDKLEREGHILVTRNKKDNTPKMVWGDSPTYHILNPITQLPKKIDADFAEAWSKTKLPASEEVLRADLEKAGLTPTSQVKEVVKGDVAKRKEKRRVNRKGGKTTNKHMLGVLKDYNKR